MFSYVSLERRVPQDHPLRAVRKLTDAVLGSLSGEFDKLYADDGTAFDCAGVSFCGRCCCRCSTRCARSGLLVEQIDYNLLFRWFVGLGMDDAVWEHSVFSKNRDRLLTSAVAQRFFAEVNRRAKKFMSDEHFTVDGTLIQAWASQKSFRSKDGSDDGDGGNFHGQKRSNETHASSTDPDARLYKKSYGKESKLSYLGHALVENRNGLIAAAMVTHADGFAERDAALLMLQQKQQGRSRRITVGADKAYDSRDFVTTARELNVTPHVTKNDKGRRSNLDRRTTRQPGYAISLSRRWLVEKGLRMAEANRPAAPGQAARLGKSGLAVRLQLRRAQPAPAPETDGSTTTGKAQGAVCLNPDLKPRDRLPMRRKAPQTLRKHQVQTDFKPRTKQIPRKAARTQRISPSS